MAGVEGSLTSHLQSLTLSDKSAIALKKVEENYILDIAVQTNTPGKQKLVAATSSNHDIRLYQHADLAMVGKLRGHSDVITGIQFANTEEDILFSSALDKCIKCWDKRSGKCVQNFEAPEEIKGLSSFGINCNDRVLAGGTECLTTAEDIHILFWDRRKTEVMGSYSESHQDDITQVKFHPSQPDNLATGSTDGLVCVFDISLTSEDDAITWTFNTESSVARIGWTGEKQSDVYCITHDDTLHVWDSVEGDDVLNRTNIRDELQDTELFDYMVDCIYVDQLYLVLGTHSCPRHRQQLDCRDDEGIEQFINDIKVGKSRHLCDPIGLNEIYRLMALDQRKWPKIGELRIATVDETLKIVKTLKGGHSSTVRCLHWDNTTCTLLSGAEDSLLCKWSDCVQKPDTQRVNFKMKKKEAKKVKPY